MLIFQIRLEDRVKADRYGSNSTDEEAIRNKPIG
jgi:hypothetical protein